MDSITLLLVLVLVAVLAAIVLLVVLLLRKPDNAAGDRLHAVFHMDAKLRPVSQQAAVGLAVRRSRDEHDVADACHQQHAQRIIDHRLVIDRDQGF